MTTARFAGLYWLLALALLLAACAGEKGEETLEISHQGASLQPLAGPELYFVAHPDDDLLFINPEIENAIRGGRSVTVVYVTSGDAGQGAAYWQSRELGMRSAYAAMAGTSSTWSCGTQSYGGKNVTQCSLTPKPTVSLVFMRLRDGQVPQLWATSNGAPFFVAPKTSETTVDSATTYTRAQVLTTIRAIIAGVAPTKIGTLDSTLAYGPDEHTDHTASALFVLEAAHGYGSTYELKMYRGYTEFQTWDSNVANEARNLSQADHDEKVRIFLTYGEAVDPGGLYDEWIWRHYAISRVWGGTGAIVQGSKCLDVTGGAAINNAAVIGAACVAGRSSQNWKVQGNGTITGIGGLCLAVGSNGTAVQISTCAAGSTSQSWSLMSNGQLRGVNGACVTLGSSGSTVTAALCDGDLSTLFGVPLASQRWVQPFTAPSGWSSGASFSDAELPAATNYASFQLADIDGDGRADACARRSDGLYCALNTAGQGFAAEALVSPAFADASGWQADANGTTLQFGDLNGDGRADVCGRKGDGVYCALWNGSTLGSLTRWTPDFSDAAGFGASATTYGSLRLADVNGDGRADVCGRGAAGLYCALNAGGSFGAAALWSSGFSDAAGWSNAATAILMADVNGDGRADVCGRSASGVSCALAPAAGTGFGPLRPWSMRTDFSDAAGWGGSAATYGSIRLGDVTGDGFADLCGRSTSGVVCAISNGLSFDVAAPLGGSSFSDASGWSSVVRGSSVRLADLDLDGRLDVCGRAASGVVCSLAAGSGALPVTPTLDGGADGGGLGDGNGADAGDAGSTDAAVAADARDGADAVGSGDAGIDSGSVLDGGGSDARASDAGGGIDAAANDAAARVDAAGSDAGVGVDAGTGTDAAGVVDSGSSIDAGGTDAGGANASGAYLYVVAHPDDDLLFMNPDIENALIGGHAIRTVYVTSGDAGEPASYWQSREEGIRNANAAMANVANTWSCGARTYAGKTGTLCTLTPKPAATVLFLRLPDGGLPALFATDNGPPFWVTPVASEATVDGANTYTRAQLISVLSAVITEVAPQRVNTLDGTLANGDDHTDHVTSAMFMLEAIHAQGGVPEMRSYRGYSMFQNWFAVPTPMPRNLSTAQHNEKTRLMTAYGSTPATGDLYDEWCWRQYFTAGILGGPGPLTGQGNRCINVAGSSVTATACSGAASQSWTLQSNGDITGVGGVCLAVGADATSLTAVTCSGAPKQKWTLLDNGQLRGAGATCVTLGGDNTTLAAASCDSQQVGTQLTVLATQHWSH